MPTGSRRLGFRFLPPTAARLDCAIFPVYIPSLENNYNPISDLGSIVPSQTISNSFVSGRINSQGAFSSIRFDPNGTSSYGVEDFVEPGSPWEGYSFNVSGRGVIGGGNALSPGNLSTTVRNIGSNYIATITGNTSIGHLITQTRIIEGEPLIRMQMSYTNTTGSSVSVTAMRALDPDQGIGQGLGFSTQNFRGSNTISRNDIVFAFSGTEGMAVYVPGNGYAHNTGIVGSWPSFNPDLYLTETSNNTADWAIGGAWNFGTILPNSTVTVCCYYIFGRTVNSILSRIEL
jgi:hypothetical protein